MVLPSEVAPLRGTKKRSPLGWTSKNRFRMGARLERMSREHLGSRHVERTRVGDSSHVDRERRIDFVEAQALWLDLHRFEAPTRSDAEPRSVLIARWDEHHWTAVITHRAGRVRIISVRRARDEEVAIYEG